MNTVETVLGRATDSYGQCIEARLVEDPSGEHDTMTEILVSGSSGQRVYLQFIRSNDRSAIVRMLKDVIKTLST